jgi:sialate O-acetylesterase
MTHRHRLACLSIPFALICLVASAHADVKLASIFGDSMVLQRELPVPVWGWAEPGEAVTVTLGSQTKKAEADKDGKWQVKLDALETNAEGLTLAVEGNNKIELNGVLVGEVWICSGQSNMEWSLSSSFALFGNLSSIEKSGLRRIRELNLQTRFLWHGSRSRWNLPSRSKRCYSPSRPFSPLPAFKPSAC